jgi:hypothetical protein
MNTAEKLTALWNDVHTALDMAEDQVTRLTHVEAVVAGIQDQLSRIEARLKAYCFASGEINIW